MNAERAQIDLLRHGEPVGGMRFRGSQDDPLSAEGWARMREAVATAGPWDAMVSSPLARCLAFAEQFAEAEGCPLEIDDRLREIYFGEWEGCSYGELLARSPLALARFCRDPLNHPPPGGEPVLEFQARVLAALDELSARHRRRRLLVVTHGGVIRLALCRLRGWPLSRMLEIDVPYASLHPLREAAS